MESHTTLRKTRFHIKKDMKLDLKHIHQLSVDWLTDGAEMIIDSI